MAELNADQIAKLSSLLQVTDTAEKIGSKLVIRSEDKSGYRKKWLYSFL